VAPAVGGLTLKLGTPAGADSGGTPARAPGPQGAGGDPPVAGQGDRPPAHGDRAVTGSDPDRWGDQRAAGSLPTRSGTISCSSVHESGTPPSRATSTTWSGAVPTSYWQNSPSPVKVSSAG
jgi:hypothetical protein